MRNFIIVLRTAMCVAFIYCAALCTAAELNISAFGGRSGDGSDTTPAVYRALRECGKPGADKLVFPEGRYEFWPDMAVERYEFISNNDEGLKRIAFLMDGLDDVVIDGQGSEFVFHGFINPFILHHCKNISFENFSIDVSRPFHSEAIILGSDEEGMDVEISEGFPFKVHRGTLLFTDGEKQSGPLTTVSKGNIYGSSHMLEYDTGRRETAYMARDFYFSSINGYPAELLGGRKVRIRVPQLAGKVGNTMVFGPNHRNYPGFALSDSSDVLFRNVTIHHAGGMGILGQRTHNITVDHCKVTPSKGRMVSTTADATHFVNCTGKITLTDNLFENQKDDATNIHGIYVQVVEKTGDDEIIVKLMHRQQFGFDFLEPGVKIELVRAKSMITYATAIVKKATRINKEFTRVSFEKPVPENLIPGDAIAAIRDYPEVTIADNTIRNNRARGMLLNCRGKTVVENNHFHTPGAAILFEGDSCFWFEQGGVRDCVIRNNTFENCMFGVWGTAVIDVKAGIRENKETSRYNRNVLIEGNTFLMYDEGTLLNAYCVDGLTWRKNTIKKTTEYPARKGTFKRFEVNNCDNVNIEK